jgi:hypothetical protein
VHLGQYKQQTRIDADILFKGYGVHNKIPSANDVPKWSTIQVLNMHNIAHLLCCESLDMERDDKITIIKTKFLQG